MQIFSIICSRVCKYFPEANKKKNKSLFSMFSSTERIKIQDDNIVHL